MRARIGPLSAVFTGEVTLADLDPPSSYSLRVSAKGGAAGVGKGEARVTLIEEGGATLLRYAVENPVLALPESCRVSKLDATGQNFAVPCPRFLFRPSIRETFCESDAIAARIGRCEQWHHVC